MVASLGVGFRCRFLIVLAAAAAACRGPVPAAPDGGADAGTGLVADAVYAAGPFSVAAGGEIVICTFVQAQNDQDVDISSFVSHQSPGGHHLIVYTVDHPIDLSPTPCPQGGQPGWDYIYGTQDENDSWQLPPGVGFHLKAHQQLALETHFIDATPEPLEVSSAFGVNYAPAGSVTQRASVFYFGTENLDLPPGAPSRAEAFCSPPDPIVIHAIVGHEHRYGTGVTVGFVPDGGGEQTIYQTRQWDSPPMLHLDGGLAVGPTDRLHVICDWDNSSTSAVTFPGEMCFAVGAYWPSQALLFCAASGGSSDCSCGYGVPLDTGPGGSQVQAVVQRQASIAGVKGDPASGAPIYCALYRAQDWAGVQPAAGAEALYVDYVTGEALPDTAAAASMTFVDVTPGDYVATCFMDTIAGGSTPGSGDPTNLGGAFVTAVKGQTATAAVVLDYAIP